MSHFEAIAVRNFLNEAEIGEDVIDGVGITVGEMRAVARRQLAGSIVVAILVAAVAGLAALKPTSLEGASAPLHELTVVHQPTLAPPFARDVAAAKNTSETP
jgi:hypothetical protein